MYNLAGCWVLICFIGNDIKYDDCNNKYDHNVRSQEEKKMGVINYSIFFSCTILVTLSGREKMGVINYQDFSVVPPFVKVHFYERFVFA